VNTTLQNEEPLVSVIIPVYNAEDHLQQTLESVLAQTYDNYEVLIVDDGSQDGSLRIAEEVRAHHPDRFRVLRHPNGGNRGVSASRNLGLHHAQGTRVAFLDADDWWYPEKLRRQVAFMRENPSLKLTYTRAAIHRKGGGEAFLPGEEVLGSPTHPNPQVTLIQIIRVEINYIFSTVMVDTEAIRSVGGFAEGLPFQSEDRLMVAKVAAMHPVGRCPDVLSEYRAHDASYTARVIARRLPPAIFFDTQVRTVRWMLHSAIHTDWAKRIGKHILPMSFARGCMCSLEPGVQSVVLRDFAWLLVRFPATPFRMVGLFIRFLKGGHIFARGFDLVRRTAAYRAIFGKKQAETSQ